MNMYLICTVLIKPYQIRIQNIADSWQSRAELAEVLLRTVVCNTKYMDVVRPAVACASVQS